MNNVDRQPPGSADLQKSFGMEARDFACILLPHIDYDSQLRAIGSLLDLHRQNAKRRSEAIQGIERELPHLSGVQSDLASDERVEMLHRSVYEDAAHSMAAIGMLAPLIETIFYQAFQSARPYFGDAAEQLLFHRKLEADAETRWDCRFIWAKGKKVGNSVEGIMQLSAAIGLDEFLPCNIRETLSAVFAYRNKMFHLGFEWPTDERKRFSARIVSEKWPANWFAWATSNSEPWVCYMTDTLIFECVTQIGNVLHGLGRFVVEKLPNPTG
ncbi:hypothetical protein FHW58_002252 [Duganella sp. 1224]|uniref:hypothetical protein n=1 Tax=Duganella sp. 1224 TaxID=2587052 RepID=UPI0015C9BC84|nr:hypothetical protein [Duganella sp. 1224]NYE61100.1 hypothetical protein [Duganella sp. 1224]